MVPPGGRLCYVRSAYGEIVPQYDFEVWDHWQAELMACDVIHDWTHSGAVLEELWIENPTKPVLHTYNGISWLHPRMGKRNATVPSEAARQAAIEGKGPWEGVYGIPEETRNEFAGRLHDARVVYWGTDVDFYTPEPEPALVAGVELEPGYLLYVGRPHPAKGVDLVLGLAEMLPEERFVLAWRAANDDHRTYERRFLEWAARLPNVQCLELPDVGHHEAKRSLYRNARLFLSPHRYLEAFGMTGIEAMACGTPAILGANGAGPEIITRPWLGALVDAHEEPVIALRQLEAAIYKAGEFDGERCRQMVVDRFSMAAIVPRYQALYGEVMTGALW